MKNQFPASRRDFLKQSTFGAAALATGKWNVRTQSVRAANERIGIGIIGSGDRASAHMQEIFPNAVKQNVQIVAICDVWKRNREAAAARVKKSQGQEPKQFSRFAELLALPEVDAVTIATPDFSHAPILLAALAAGKDVYVEKPMCIDIPSANQAFDLARAKDRVVQAGTQRRSDGQHIGAAKFIASGALGQISRVTASVNFNHARWARRYDDCREEDVDWEAFLLHLPKRSFDPKLLRRWQMARECTNGLAGLWMTHYSDSVHMLTGARYPTCGVSLGGIYVWKDGREHTDTFHTILEYPEGFLFDWGMGLGNAAGVFFGIHGTKGTVDVERWTFTPEGVAASRNPATKIQAEGGTGHITNWLQCLRTRAKPNADIEFGHQHVVATVMSATALETGRRQKWDPAKRELVAG